jgi:phosphotriesterase-related protein
MTLVHEHLLVGYPGWFLDALAPPFRRAEALSRGGDRLSELLGFGVRTFLDPCPMDLGRDVEFMAEVAQRSGMRIVCTTGAYKENEGLTYTFGALPVEEITAIYVKELTEGIGETGIRAGLVKVATGAPTMSDYERKLLTAAGRAAAAVGCPVITHTDHATGGMEQIALLTGEGVPAHRILVGHSDGRDDHAYHRSLADAGSYVGFDRFGIESLISDERRIESVVALVESGYTRSLCLSHDATCAAWLGRPIFGGRMVVTPEMLSAAMPNWESTHLFKRIIPRLLDRGVTQADIETLLVSNPRRYFEGVEAPR